MRMEELSDDFNLQNTLELNSIFFSQTIQLFSSF